jgi:hypothetical protein
VLLRLAYRVGFLARCFVELFKNVEQLDAVLLFLLLLQVDLVVLVEILLPLFRILEFTLRVLPRLFGFEGTGVYLSRLAFGITHQLLLVPFSKTILVV